MTTTTTTTTDGQPATAPATTTSFAARAIDVVKTHGRGEAAVRALDGASVAIPTGRFTAVMGPSGSGKSTLVHALAGLDGIDSGRVLVGDTDLTELSERERTLLRRERLGFVFQAFNLVPSLTAAENIALPLTLAGKRPDPAWLAELVDRHPQQAQHFGRGGGVEVAGGLVGEHDGGAADERADARDAVRARVDGIGEQPLADRGREPVHGAGGGGIHATHRRRAAGSRPPTAGPSGDPGSRRPSIARRRRRCGHRRGTAPGRPPRRRSRRA